MMQRQKRNGQGLRTVRGKEATEEAEAMRESLENVEDAWEDENSLSASGSSYRSPDEGLRMESAPAVMAKMLHENLVAGRSTDVLVETLHIPEHHVEVFREKVALYREAVILMRLIAESKQQERFASVQRAYEEILFGATPTREGLEKLKALKDAMADLREIAQENSRHASWARQWFADMGYDVTNPITNSLLAMTWMEEYIGTAKAIKECLAVMP
ncbi:MAG: hypothetical protein WCC18_13785 [Candidatus Acidiferrales bacterium]